MTSQRAPEVLMPWMLLAIKELRIKPDDLMKMGKHLNSSSIDAFVEFWINELAFSWPQNQRNLSVSLLRCTWWVIRGMYQSILSENLKVTEPPNPASQKNLVDSYSEQDPSRLDVLLACLISLKGLAIFRSRSAKQGQQEWLALSTIKQGRYLWAFQNFLELHQAVALAQIGHCKSALVLLADYKTEDRIQDSHSRSIFYGAMAGICETLGNFSTSLFWNEKDFKLSVDIGNHFWKNATRRRKINTQFEQEQSQTALESINAWLRVPDFSPITEVLLHKTKFRCLLQIGHVDLALDCFNTVLKRMEELKISETAVSLIEEQSEINLLKRIKNLHIESNEVEAIEAKLKHYLGLAIANDDISTEANLRLAQGRWHLSQGSYSQALGNLEASLAICARQGFQKTKALCQMYIAQALWAQNDTKNSRTHLLEAHNLATELGIFETVLSLNLIKILFAAKSETFIEDLIDISFKIKASAFIRLQVPATSGLQWSFFDLGPSSQASKKVTKLSFWAGIDHLVHSKGQLTLTPSGFLKQLSSQKKSITLECDLVLLRLLNSKDFKLTYDEVVSLRNDRVCFYHSLQHGASMRMYLTRLRQKLLPFGLGIKAYNNTHSIQLIFLKDEDTASNKILKIKLFQQKISQTIENSDSLNFDALKNTSALILDFIKTHRMVSLSQLKDQFKVSRQALFRQLAFLRRLQLISHSKSGRQSLYVVNNPLS
jgi:tetratricopeptide (TPR) repeat protein